MWSTIFFGKHLITVGDLGDENMFLHLHAQNFVRFNMDFYTKCFFSNALAFMTNGRPQWCYIWQLYFWKAEHDSFVRNNPWACYWAASTRRHSGHSYPLGIQENVTKRYCWVLAKPFSLQNIFIEKLSNSGAALMSCDLYILVKWTGIMGINKKFSWTK